MSHQKNGASVDALYLNEQRLADCPFCVQVQRFNKRLNVCARSYVLQSHVPVTSC